MITTNAKTLHSNEWPINLDLNSQDDAQDIGLKSTISSVDTSGLPSQLWAVRGEFISTGVMKLRRMNSWFCIVRSSRTHAHRVEGAITWRSICEGLLCAASASEFLERETVERHVDPRIQTRIYRADDSFLDDIVHDAMRNGFVLRADSSGIINAVITVEDLLNQISNDSRPFNIIADIERSLRRALTAYAGIELVRQLVIRDEGVLLDNIESLLFSEYSALLADSRVWNLVALPGADQQGLRALLEHARDPRNKVMHFRGTLSESELQVLRTLREMMHGGLRSR